MILLLSMFLGIALGLRFKVLVLLPAAAAVLAVAAGNGIVRGNGPGATLIAIIADETWLQMGYLLGAGILVALTLRRGPRSETAGRGTSQATAGAG
jgi:hypothetical protein